MKTDGSDAWINHYRASVADPSTPDLDQAILVAARQHAVRTRAKRRASRVAFATAFSALTLAVVWTYRAPVPYPLPSAVDAGRLEGASLPFLLDAGRTAYIGPGSSEGIP